MTQEITMKKSTYNQILAGVVVLAIAFSFALGFIAGGGKLGASEPTQVVQQPTVQAPEQQQPEEPSRVVVSIDDDAILGNSDAPLTIIEFSDFECPFCKRAFTDAVAGVKKDYVETGKVKFVYRDFPLSFHQNAHIEAQAAECAKEQNKFWEYHDQIFERTASNGVGLSTDQLPVIAKDIGLDVDKFSTCLSSGKYKAEVDKDFADGQAAGVSGTPTFYIGNAQRGYTQVVGAQPYAVLKQVIEQELAG